MRAHCVVPIRNAWAQTAKLLAEAQLTVEREIYSAKRNPAPLSALSGKD